MKKVSTIFIVLLVIGVLFLTGCAGNVEHERVEQDIETILESELLASYGIEVSKSHITYYSFQHPRRGVIEIDVALHVLGEHGAYFFTPGGWTDELIAELVLVSEEGIRFAKDFLGIEVSRPLSFVFNVTEPDENHPLPIWGGGGVVDTSTFISIDARFLPSLIVHEAVHAILEYDGRQSNFPRPPESSIFWRGANFLEEGLCDVVEFLFSMQTEHRYLTNYGDDHLHTKALQMFDYHNGFEDETEFGTRYHQLMSYQTAASFIYFLLEYHGTIEDFMRAFEDIYLLEELFGANMSEMIAKWLTYLDGLQ